MATPGPKIVSHSVQPRQGVSQSQTPTGKHSHAALRKSDTEEDWTLITDQEDIDAIYYGTQSPSAHGGGTETTDSSGVSQSREREKQSGQQKSQEDVAKLLKEKDREILSLKRKVDQTQELDKQLKEATIQFSEKVHEKEVLFGEKRRLEEENHKRNQDVLSLREEVKRLSDTIAQVKHTEGVMETDGAKKEESESSGVSQSREREKQSGQQKPQEDVTKLLKEKDREILSLKRKVDQAEELDKQLKAAGIELTKRVQEKEVLFGEKRRLEEESHKRNQEVLSLREQVKSLSDTIAQVKHTEGVMETDGAKKEESEQHLDVDDVSIEFGSNEIAELKAQVWVLERQLKEACDHSKAQSRTVLELKQRAQGAEMVATEELESYKGLFAEAEEEGNRLRKQVGHLRGENEHLTQQLSSVQHQLHLTQQEFFQASQDLAVMKNEREQLEARLPKVGTLSAAANCELQKQVRELQIERDKAKSEAETAQAQALVYKSDFEDERIDREKAHSNMADLENKCEQIKGLLTEENAELKRQLAIQRDELARTNEQLRKHGALLSETERSYEKSQEEARKLNEYWLTEAEKLKGKEKEYKDECDLLRRKIRQAESQVEGLQKKLKRTEEELAKMKRKKGPDLELSDENKELKGQVQALKTSVKQLEEKLQIEQDEAKNTLEATKTQMIQEHQARLEQHRTEVQATERAEREAQERFQETIHQLQQQLSDVERRAANSETRLVDATRQLGEAIQRTVEAERRATLAAGGDELAPFILHFQDPLPADRKIGSGCYGTVYAIEVDGIQCIAKRVQDILLGEGGEEDVGGRQRGAIQEKFRQECILLSKVRHPNLVQFMGVRYGRDKYDLTLVMERLPMDLQRCLERCQADQFFIPLSFRMSILLDVTYGLLHLHNRSILHRDLTAGNILLTSNLRAKIADLGVSRIVQTRYSQKLSKLPGTIGYMPPEALKDEPEYNLKLDAFSFGVLALFVSLQEFPEFSWENVPQEFEAKGETALYKRRKWMTKIGERHLLYPLIRQCLQDNSDARPDTARLNAMMKQLSTQFPHRLKDINEMFTQLVKLGMSDVRIQPGRFL